MFSVLPKELQIVLVSFCNDTTNDKLYYYTNIDQKTLPEVVQEHWIRRFAEHKITVGTELYSYHTKGDTYTDQFVLPHSIFFSVVQKIDKNILICTKRKQQLIRQEPYIVDRIHPYSRFTYESGENTHKLIKYRYNEHMKPVYEGDDLEYQQIFLYLQRNVDGTTLPIVDEICNTRPTIKRYGGREIRNKWLADHFHFGIRKTNHCHFGNKRGILYNYKTTSILINFIEENELEQI